MIRDVKRWRLWEAEYIAKTPADYARNMELTRAMYEQARALGIFPLVNPLEGLDVKIHLAKVVNVRTSPRNDRAGA